MWIACVDNTAFGFFDSEYLAERFVSEEFPVAYRQDNYRLYIFRQI